MILPAVSARTAAFSGFTKSLQNNRKKMPSRGLQFFCRHAIIYKRDCNRYAMKRKVAGGMSGNFRGVCPISNRANQDNDTVCVHTSSAWRQLCPVRAVLLFMPARKHLWFSELFYKQMLGTPAAWKVPDGEAILQPPIVQRRRKEWQSTKKSESRSRAMSMQL